MFYETKKAIESWDRDVEKEMRRLIERGVPPFEAARKATDKVSINRQANPYVGVGFGAERI